MMALVVYFTFTCDRCNRKESTQGSASGGRVQHRTYPNDWVQIAHKDLCPNCARIVGEALRPILSTPTEATCPS
jgi:hypothetical protein